MLNKDWQHLHKYAVLQNGDKLYQLAMNRLSCLLFGGAFTRSNPGGSCGVAESTLHRAQSGFVSGHLCDLEQFVSCFWASVYQ